MLRFLSITCLYSLLFLVIGGCGLQGPLEPPQSPKKGDTSEPRQGKNEKDDTKPQKEFFLDRLLR